MRYENMKKHKDTPASILNCDCSGDYDVVNYENFYELLKGLYDNYSERTAFRFRKNGKETSVTYDSLIRQVCDLYYFYQKNDIQNCNIGILSENRYEYVTIYLSGVFQNVVAPVDRELSADELAYLIEKFDIKVIFYTDKTKEKLDCLSDKGIGRDTLRRINIDESYQTIRQDHYDPDLFFRDTEHTDSDKFSVLSFTSGTTGAIKGAMLSQRNIVSNLRAPLLYMHLESPMLQLLPMNHMYGLHPDLLSPLYNGDTVCLNMALKDIAKDFKYYDPYYIGVVPMMLEGIYKNIIREARSRNQEKRFYRLIKISNWLRKRRIDIRRILFQNLINKRLRIIVCGGAPLDPVYVDKFDEIGLTVLNGYGMTECSPLISVNRDRNNIRGSAGAVIHGTDVRIAGDGEILVKGQNVMSGYYHDKEETDRSFTNGYYKTGDLGYLEDGILYVTGRKKNLIILKNGKNFSPEAIEQKLLRLPYIKECLVTAETRGSIDAVTAKILLTDGVDKEDAAGRLKEDLDAINQSLPAYMRIDDYDLVSEAFEKTSTNKIKRDSGLRRPAAR